MLGTIPPTLHPHARTSPFLTHSALPPFLPARDTPPLRSQVTEERLVSMLEQISEKESAKPKLTIQRRRPNLFDDDD